MVFWSHYSDVENTPLYPFGHGLSYTSFKYDLLKLDRKEYSVNDKVTVSVNIKNTGQVMGKEVVQLYIQDLFASITRPVKELKSFRMVELKPGESKSIEFILDKSSFGFFDNDGKYIIEPGKFKVYIGGSSYTDLEAGFELK